MAKKVYIAELDAHTATLIKKLEEVQQQTVIAGQKMNAAFNKVTTAMEKDMAKTAGSLTKFSRRDLGLMANQLLWTAGTTGKLTGQLANLATGLATGGVIGAAFAGFAALINVLTEEFKDQKEELSGLRKEYDEMIKKKDEFNKYDMQAYGILASKKKELEDNIHLYESVKDLRMDEKLQLGAYRSELDKVNDDLRFFVYVWEKAGMFEKESNKDLKNRVTTYDELLKRLEKYSDYISPRGIDTGALLKGIGTKTDFTKDKFEVSPIEDWYMKIWKPEVGDDMNKSLSEAQQPMSALVSLSNQMASNFQFAGHTFVGKLSQAIAMIDSISNMVLTIASMFGGGGGFGLGGLLGLIGLEKGGRVSNKFGNVTFTPIPSFARGGSYSTPAFSGPFGGGYPVMVHKNETLDVYNSGQTSRLESKLDGIKNAVMAGTIASTRKRGGGGQPINIMIGKKVIATVVQEELNRMTKSGYNLNEL